MNRIDAVRTSDAPPGGSHDPVVADRRTMRRRAWWLSIGFWGFELAFLELRRWLAQTDADPLALAFGRLAWLASGLLVGAVVYLALERKLHQPFHKTIWTAAALILLGGLVHSVGNVFLLDMIVAEPPRMAVVQYEVARFWMHFYFAWGASILALLYAQRAKREEESRIQAQKAAQSAQLQALHHQLKPHFLFNTLNSIAALILDGRANSAERLIRRLSDLLRSGLSSGPADKVRLAREIAVQAGYLEIERVRYPERLRFRIELPPELESALVPSGIFQALVESAVTDGVAVSPSPVTIRLSVRARDGRLELVVSDDAQRVPGGGNDQAIRHTEELLDIAYGGQGSVLVDGSEAGCEAVVVVPLHCEPSGTDAGKAGAAAQAPSFSRSSVQRSTS